MVVALGALIAPQAAAAQWVGCTALSCAGEADSFRSDRLQGHLLTLGTNAMLGGLTAGVTQRLRGGAFGDAFVHGAAGGAGVYVGKRLAVSSSPAAGLAGRQVAAIGASVSRNAADGRPAFERLVLPIGPALVRLDLAGGARGHVTLDLVGLGALGMIALSSHAARVDWGSTLSSGTFVFDVDSGDDHSWAARHIAGAIVLDRDPGRTNQPRSVLLAHERVHLLQYDQAFILWADPAERALFRRLPYPKFTRYVSFSLQAIATHAIGAVIAYDKQPWEMEAHFLDRGVRGGGRGGQPGPWW